MTSRPHPPAAPHGAIREVLPDVFFVSGTTRLPGALPVRFSRNMTVFREGGRLVVVNSVRLSEDGLAQLDRLGKVTDVIRIAAFHGMDDPFYKERYGARTWSVAGQKYVTGFDLRSDPYLVPDVEIGPSTELPLSGAKVYVIGSSPPEGMLLVERHGGVLVSGDAFQNWQKPDEFFSLMARPMMRFMGFIKPYNIGPAWLRNTKPPAASLRGLLELPFSHVFPAHGEVVQGNARELYRPVVTTTCEKL